MSSESSPSTTPDTPKPETKKTSPWLIIVVVLGFLFVMCIVATILLVGFVLPARFSVSDTEPYGTETTDSDYTIDEYEEVEDEDEEEDEEEAEEFTLFEGDFVTAQLPEGWTIVEYLNGDGTTMLVDQPYTGITALKVFTPDSEEAFSLRGIDGIGGIDACDTYYQFADDSPGYLAEKQTQADEMFMTLTIQDLSATEYTEFTLFDIPVRRIGTTLYEDSLPGNEFFEASCGINELLEIEQLTFNGGGYDSHTFSKTIDPTLTDTELLQLDSILESLDEI